MLHARRDRLGSFRHMGQIAGICLLLELLDGKLQIHKAACWLVSRCAQEIKFFGLLPELHQLRIYCRLRRKLWLTLCVVDVFHKLVSFNQLFVGELQLLRYCTVLMGSP